MYLRSRTGVRASFMALTFASGSRAVPHATAHDAVHDAFMTLPPYIRSREGEVHELGCGVRNCSHTARSRPVEASSESIERAGEGTSAEGTARCASRGFNEHSARFLCSLKRHTLTERAHFVREMCWPLKRSQRLVASQELSPRSPFEHKNPPRASGEISIDGHSDQCMP